jgi:hypothetical protein
MISIGNKIMNHNMIIIMYLMVFLRIFHFLHIVVCFLDIPEDGVPPRDVLKKMFPDKKLTPECVVQVSMTDFDGWVETMKTSYEERQTAVGNIINSTLNSNGGRRKRSTFVKPDAFCASLLPSNSWTYGINPKVQGNSIDEVKKAAIICECKNAPWKRVRKQIKYKYCYSENLVDPKNDEFKSLKIEIEKNVSNIYLFIYSHSHMYSFI